LHTPEASQTHTHPHPHLWYGCGENREKKKTENTGQTPGLILMM
jgi:hypothetical protein